MNVYLRRAGALVALALINFLAAPAVRAQEAAQRRAVAFEQGMRHETLLRVGRRQLETGVLRSMATRGPRQPARHRHVSSSGSDDFSRNITENRNDRPQRIALPCPVRCDAGQSSNVTLTLSVTG